MFLCKKFLLNYYIMDDIIYYWNNDTKDYFLKIINNLYETVISKVPDTNNRPEKNLEIISEKIFSKGKFLVHKTAYLRLDDSQVIETKFIFIKYSDGSFVCYYNYFGFLINLVKYMMDIDKNLEISSDILKSHPNDIRYINTILINNIIAKYCAYFINYEIYTLEKNFVLGKGAAGSVYLYTSGNNKLAIKYVTDKSEFERELTNYDFIKKNILTNLFVKMYGTYKIDINLGDIKGNVGIVVMEHGTNSIEKLKDIIGPDRPRYLLVLSITICNMMYSLLEKNIPYSDLKIQNTVFNSQGDLRFVDFGSICSKDLNKGCTTTFTMRPYNFFNYGIAVDNLFIQIYLFIYSAINIMYGIKDLRCISDHHVRNTSDRTKCDSYTKTILQYALPEEKEYLMPLFYIVDKLYLKLSNKNQHIYLLFLEKIISMMRILYQKSYKNQNRDIDDIFNDDEFTKLNLDLSYSIYINSII